MAKLVGADGADRVGDGVAKRTVRSSEPKSRSKGTGSADSFGSLSPSEYERARRLFDATPADLKDGERLDIVASVMRMIDNRRPV